MRVRYLLWFVLGAGLGACSFKFEGPQTLLQVVKTTNGVVSGEVIDGVYVFKGIPYAAPPLGDLRWKAPHKVEPWKDTLKCLSFSASPVQNDPKPFRMWTKEFIAPPEPLSEDCLYLNVWTSAQTPSEKLPVLVWIYGGAFISGSSACPIYDGEALARQGIVFVSINYRLGVFGFMAHPELSKESDQRSSGNYGLMDQIAALRWVKENIAAFGGDPERVTIAGQSAGSMSVQALVASPLTKGLLHGAIAQSGAMTSRSSMALPEAEQIGQSLSGMINGDLASLRKLPADSVLHLANGLPFGSFSPIVDGYVLPSSVKEIFQKKLHQNVPLMAGWVTGDGAMREVKSAKAFKHYVDSVFKDKSIEFLKLFPSTSEEEGIASQRKLGLIQFAAFPSHDWASSNTAPSYLYQFSYVPTDKPGFPNYGAFHTAEVPFALHTLKHWDRPWKDQDYSVEKYLSSYWLNFIKNGNPNGDGLAEWKTYEVSTGNIIMELGQSPLPSPGLFEKEFQLIKQ